MSNHTTATTPPAEVWLIVPVFNAEDYLDACLHSIATQTFTNLHVLIVDDGSTDSSQEIALARCRTDSRFELIRTRHGGVSRARNIGIDMAKGRYIGFVDADDCLYPWAIGRLVDVIKSTGAQVCAGAFDRSASYSIPAEKKSAPIVMDYVTAMTEALYQHIILNSPWGMLMERRLLGDTIRFNEHIRYEDLDAFYRFYENADKIAYINEKIYFYRQAAGSFMHKWSRQRLDALDVTDRIVEFMSQRYPTVVPAAIDRRFSAYFNILLLMLRENIEDNESIGRCLSIIKSTRRHALSNRHVRLKNKIGALASYGGLNLLRRLAKLY